MLKEIGYDRVARAVCSPVYGVGADQMILWSHFLNGHRMDVNMAVYNGPDGEEVEMCGNGARCLAKLAFQKLLKSKDRKEVWIYTNLAGRKVARREENNLISVEMGEGDYVGEHELDLGHCYILGHKVNVENPHFVVFPDGEYEGFSLKSSAKVWGKQVEKHPEFPNKTNVEFVSIKQRGVVDIEVWKRGAGYTLACGTGACAVAFAGYKAGLLDPDVQVNFPIGSLRVGIDKRDRITMTGPASYCGQFILDDLTHAIEGTEKMRELRE